MADPMGVDGTKSEPKGRGYLFVALAQADNKSLHNPQRGPVTEQNRIYVNFGMRQYCPVPCKERSSTAGMKTSKQELTGCEEDRTSEAIQEHWSES